MALPPGPPLPALVQTLLFVLRPAEFLEQCRKRYGDVFTVTTLMFGREVEIASPDLVKQVFTTDPDIVRAGEANAFLEPMVGRRSVLLLDGAEHVRQRRLMMPPFHGEHVLAYGRIMRAITERVVATWPVGKKLSLHKHMQRITLEIILETVFGTGEGEAKEELSEALARVLDRQSDPLAALGQMPPLRKSFFGLTPWDGFLRDVASADALIYKQIARRREAPTGAGRRDDVLAMLLDARDEDGKPMTDVELRDELMTLLVAGHETTASMLCWAFELLLAAPRARDELLRELDAAPGSPAAHGTNGASNGATNGAGEPDLGAIAKLPYLDATLREVLRLRPVIPAVGRRLHAPMKLGGYDIPAGELLVPVMWMTHRLPSVYPSPETFDPSRFIGEKPDPYAWYPFGGGARRCLGMAFALYEMKVVLATVLSRVRLRKARPDPARVVLRGFTFVPDGGAEVVVEARLDRSARPAHRAAAAEART